VNVSVQAAELASRAGIHGVIFDVSRADRAASAARVALDVDYSSFANAYGGDFASRLRLVSLPACVLSTPEVAACRVQTPVAASSNQVGARTVSVDSLLVAAGSTAATTPAAPSSGSAPATTVSSGATVYAVAASASSPSGDYTQTSLSPTYSWAAGGQGGDFTYSYPLRVPPSLGGPAPDLTLQYSSGSVDGRSVRNNSQASWVGEGWELNVGYIERQYRTCSDDGGSTGDLCWYSDNATMVFGGQSVKLAIDPNTGAWKATDDNGMKIERLYQANNGAQGGEYWLVTKLDGTQYYFGRHPGNADTGSVQTVPVYGNNPNEPCYNANSGYLQRCWQAYRWDLDYVKDPRGNSMTYYYTPYWGQYGGVNGTQGGNTYVLSALLDHIDYGTRDGQSGPAPMRVQFNETARCKDGTTCSGHPENWPDTPWDQWCDPNASSCGSMYSPAFWTPYKLDSVESQVLTDATTATYRDVDKYQFSYLYPDNGDGTSPSLWLNRITHIGNATGTGIAAGMVSEPDVHFGGNPYANRADAVSPALNHYRITVIDNSVGGWTTVHYRGANCVKGSPPWPSTSQMLCYPQWYAPPGGTAGFVWFNKWVVDEVVANDKTGGSPPERWHYDYTSDGTSDLTLWHYDDNDITPPTVRTWNQWRGYPTVITTHGPVGGQQTVTKDLYYRGMDGDHLDSGNGWRSVILTDSQGSTPDNQDLPGVLREHTVLDGSTVLSSTIHEPWISSVGSYPNVIAMHRDQKVRTRTWLAAKATWRWAETDTVYDSYGLVTDVKDLGDQATSNDDVCTHTDYAARSTTTYLINFPSQVESTDCAANPGPTDYLSGTRYVYDNKAFGEAPIQGLVNETFALDNTGADGFHKTSWTNYDTYGRPKETWDALNHETTTAYTPAIGGPVTAVTVKNPAGWTTTTNLDPGWGLPTSTVDVNGKTTTAQYDALGRLLKVWRNNRATSLTPDAQFNYTLLGAAGNWTQSLTLGPNGTQVASYQTYDGLLRPRQTQTPTSYYNNGRDITDTTYDGRGLAVKTSTFWNSSPPDSTLVSFVDTDVPNQHRYTYDNLGRQETDEQWKNGTRQWLTTTAYDGDRTTVTPPAGGTPTTTYLDARGHATELDQYLGSTPSGTYQATTYGYDRLGRQTAVTDPAGNQWTTTYNLRGWVSTKKDPDTGTSTMTYDDNGNLLTTTDARQITLTNVYNDPLDRRTAEWQGPADTGTKLLDFTYDTLTNAKGQLTTANRYANGGTYSTTVTGYDDAYRPLGTMVTIPASDGFSPNSWTTKQSYNVDGSVATTTLPAAGGLGQETVTTTYDNLGSSRTMTGLDTYVSATWNDAFGRIGQFDLGADQGVHLATSYDSATGRLVSTRVGTGGSSSVWSTWTNLIQTAYAWDPAGNLTNKTNIEADGSTNRECFAYDGLRQLTQAWTTTATACQATPTQAVVGGPDAYWQTYTYDNATGNRKKLVNHTATGDTTSTYTYPAANAQPHTLSSVTLSGASTGTSSYGYDADGNTKSRNLVGKPGQTLTWDAEGHLATLTANGNTTSYIYDATGNRLIAKDNTGETLYLGPTEIHRTTAGAVTCTRYYSYNGGVIAVRTDPGTLTWQAVDNHGTAELSVNATTKAIASRLRSDPFGNPRNTNPWPGTKGFVNGTIDPTGLTHLGAREYDPQAGRFISADPIFQTGDPQQIGGYTYAGNNPTTATDPNGTQCVKLDDGSGPCAGSGSGSGSGSGGGGGGGGGGGAPSNGCANPTACDHHQGIDDPGDSSCTGDNDCAHRAPPACNSAQCPLDAAHQALKAQADDMLAKYGSSTKFCLVGGWNWTCVDLASSSGGHSAGPYEVAWCHMVGLGACQTAWNALKEADRVAGIGDWKDPAWNALHHGTWMAVMVANGVDPKDAIGLGVAHELDGPATGAPGLGSLDSDYDLDNNQVGVNLGMKVRQAAVAPGTGPGKPVLPPNARRQNHAVSMTVAAEEYVREAVSAGGCAFGECFVTVSHG